MAEFKHGSGYEGGRRLEKIVTVDDTYIPEVIGMIKVDQEHNFPEVEYFETSWGGIGMVTRDAQVSIATFGNDGKYTGHRTVTFVKDGKILSDWDGVEISREDLKKTIKELMPSAIEPPEQKR